MTALRSSSLDEDASLEAEIGSRSWSVAVHRQLRLLIQTLDSDARRTLTWLEMASEHCAWRSLGYATFGLYLAKEFQLTEQFLESLRKAKHGDTIAEAIKEQTIAAKTISRGTRTDLLDGNTIKSDRGLTVNSTLRRLARDGREDLLSEIERGSTSVNAAAIKAGFRKKPTADEQCLKSFAKAENRLNVLRSIIGGLEVSERMIVLDWLNELE